MNVLFFDTETTGLLLHPRAPLAAQPQVIEFGAALVDAASGAEIETFEVLIDPGMPLPEEIVKITGITDSQLRGRPSMREAMPGICAAFRKADWCVAHNLPFDRGMLNNEALRLGIEFPWPAKSLCTMAAFRPDYGRNPRLVELYERFMGTPLAQTHRALDDVRAMVDVARESGLLKEMKR